MPPSLTHVFLLYVLIVHINFLFSVFGQSVINLNVSHIVLINKTTINHVHFNAAVSIFGDIFAISDYLCKTYYTNNEEVLSHDDETMQRCMTLLMQTFRTHRVTGMKQILAEFSNFSYFEDGDLLAER